LRAGIVAGPTSAPSRFWPIIEDKTQLETDVIRC